MEKYLAPENSASFPSNRDNKKSHHNASHMRHRSETFYTNKAEADHQERSFNVNDQSASVQQLTLPQVMEEVDQFFETLPAIKEDPKSNPIADVPKSIESLYKKVESFVFRYESRESSARFGQNKEDDVAFFDSLSRISKLLNKIGEVSSKDGMVPPVNDASNVLHQAMSLLDEEFRALLDNKRHYFQQKTPRTPKQSAFSSHFISNHEPDRFVVSENESKDDEEFPTFSPEAISNMNMIATAMISAGYESECCLVYSVFRRMAFKEQLKKLGFESISADEVQKKQWESLEGEIDTWISIFKHCYTVLFSGERKLAGSVFSAYPSVSQRLFSELVTAVIMRFLNFGEAVVLTKPSAEKLFKFLAMYETLKELIPALGDLYSCESAKDLIREISVAKSRVSEAVVTIFCELESSIKSDEGRTPVPSGQVHPLTRYTMNYLKYACEYKDTLEEIFEQHQSMDGSTETSGPEPETDKSEYDNYFDDRMPMKSPFSIKLMTVMELLDANLNMKSKLYRDPSLRFIFLMNNGRYILQKIKGSTEIHDMVGINWRRKRSTDLRQYHKNYQRETWSRVLQCISHEGLQVNGKVVKPLLKERFKNFNTSFDEIHKTQSTWVVSDEQLQSELRVSISAVVTPAYRSFVGRFRQHLDGKHGEKYIKYQPEDIEMLIDELFDGNAMSMGRRRN